MYQVDIVCQVVVDVVLLLHVLEDLVVVHGDVGDVGVGDSRTAAADATPRSATAVVDHHGFLAGFREVAEQGTTGNTATRDEHFDLFFLHAVHFGEDEGLFGVRVVEVAKADLVRQRGTRCGVANQLDAVGTQDLTGTRDATLAAARPHTHTGDVFQLIHGDGLAVADDAQHAVEFDVLAVADVGLAFAFGQFLG